MSEQRLRTMLEAFASTIATGPSPLGPIEHSARQRRRRRLAGVMLAAAVLAAGGVAVSVVADDGRQALDPSRVAESGEVLDLPTSEWRQGDAAMLAEIQGVLRVDERGCVYLGSLDPQIPSRMPVVWPAGFSATLDAGELTLYDAEGEPAARGGDELSSGGGYIPLQEQHRCVRGEEAAYVQSDVEVTGHRDPVSEHLPLPTSDWEPGDGGDGALLEGELYVDPQHCVRVGDPLRPSRATTPIWPRGFTARVENDRMTVYDPDGRAVAHDGDTISAGGGAVGDPGFASTLPCVPERGRVFSIQSEVAVVASSD